MSRETFVSSTICKVVFFVAFVWVLPAIYAQEKPSPLQVQQADHSAYVTLPRELELEEHLQLRTDERNFLMDKVDQLQLQVQQLQNVVAQVLDNMRAERSKEAEASRDAVGQKLVKLLGGDWEKNDRWDWRRRGLVRPDGTFVPLEPPKEKQ